MSNLLYPKGREGFLDGTIDWDTDDIRVVLVDSGYTYSAAHDNLDDVTGATRVATSAALTGKTVTDGVADAADLVFTALTGDTIDAIVIYQHTGTESTSRLIAYIDTDAAAAAINLTPNGGDVDLTWSDGADKIFRL